MNVNPKRMYTVENMYKDYDLNDYFLSFTFYYQPLKTCKGHEVAAHRCLQECSHLNQWWSMKWKQSRCHPAIPMKAPPWWKWRSAPLQTKGRSKRPIWTGGWAGHLKDSSGPILLTSARPGCGTSVPVTVAHKRIKRPGWRECRRLRKGCKMIFLRVSVGQRDHSLYIRTKVRWTCNARNFSQSALCRS